MDKKRVTFFVNTDRYMRLRAKLLLLGISFTKWLDTLIKKELGE